MPERHFILPEWARGEGISKGNLVPLGPPVGVRDPLRRGPGFLLLFSIKSKGERLCFAEKIPNGRTSNVVHPSHFARPRPTNRFSTKKRPFSGLFPSTIFHRQVHIRNMLPHGGIRRLIISALNRFDNLPMQFNRHINDSGVLRQRFTHCQTNPVFKGIL